MELPEHTTGEHQFISAAPHPNESTDRVPPYGLRIDLL